MSTLFGPGFITHKYLRQYPNSERARSWAGVMVHIQTENGVWRTGGNGYTWAGKPDAWVLPFEDAVKQIAHCGPEKMGRFLRAEQAPHQSREDAPAPALDQLERLANPTKAELRKIYQQWANEEIEAIELIEAVGKYLGNPLAKQGGQ